VAVTCSRNAASTFGTSRSRGARLTVFCEPGERSGSDKVGDLRQIMLPLSGAEMMRLLIALLLPWLAFFTIGRRLLAQFALFCSSR
jgi:hypothetical protein